MVRVRGHDGRKERGTTTYTSTKLVACEMVSIAKDKIEALKYMMLDVHNTLGIGNGQMPYTEACLF